MHKINRNEKSIIIVLNLMGKLVIFEVSSFAEPSCQTFEHFSLFICFNDRKMDHEHFKAVDSQVDCKKYHCEYYHIRLVLR